MHFDLTNSAILHASYLGGTTGDPYLDAYREASGDFVLAGQTTSPNFPTTVGAPQRVARTKASQVFFARVRPGRSSARLVYSTYFGGSARQTVLGIEPDGRGGVFAAGPTLSKSFPITSNAFDRSFTGARERVANIDAFLTTPIIALPTTKTDANGFASHPLPLWLTPSSCQGGPPGASNALR